MSIIIALPFRPLSGGTISKAQAESVSSLVPAKVHNGQTFAVMPQGHTADRIGADAVRPWAETCIERLGGISVPGMFILSDAHERFARTLETALVSWGPPTVLKVQDSEVAHLVKDARDAALADAVDHATSPTHLMTLLTVASATKEEIAGAVAAYQKRVRDEMAALLSEMQAKEAEAAELAKAEASKGTPVEAETKAHAPAHGGKGKGKAA